MPKPLDKVEVRAWLIDKAVRLRLSVPKIAALAGCGVWKVFNRMKKFGIPRNPVGYNLSRSGSDNIMKTPGVVNPFTGKTHSRRTRMVLSVKASVPKPYLRGEGNGMYGAKGSLNPNWKGGSAQDRQLFYSSEEWKRARRAVNLRDRRRCRRCGVGYDGFKSLHIHHILGWTEYPSLRARPRNLVTLCKQCHAWVHSSSNVNNQWRGIGAYNSRQALLGNDR